MPSERHKFSSFVAALSRGDYSAIKPHTISATGKGSTEPERHRIGKYADTKSCRHPARQDLPAGSSSSLTRFLLGPWRFFETIFWLVACRRRTGWDWPVALAALGTGASLSAFLLGAKRTVATRGGSDTRATVAFCELRSFLLY